MVKLLLSDKCLTVLVFHNKDFMTVAAICLFHIITSKLQDLYFCDEQICLQKISLYSRRVSCRINYAGSFFHNMKKLGGFPWGAFHICLRVSWVQIAGSVVCQIFRVVSQGKIVVGMLISSPHDYWFDYASRQNC